MTNGADRISSSSQQKIMNSDTQESSEQPQTQTSQTKRQTNNDQQQAEASVTALDKRAVADVANSIKIKDISTAENFKDFLIQRHKYFFDKYQKTQNDKEKYIQITLKILTPFQSIFWIGKDGIEGVLAINKDLSIKNALRVLSIFFIPVFLSLSITSFLLSLPIIGIGTISHTIDDSKRQKTISSLLAKDLAVRIFFALLTKKNMQGLDAKALQSLAKAIDKEIEKTNKQDIDFVINNYGTYDSPFDDDTNVQVKEEQLETTLQNAATKALENIIKQFDKNNQEHIKELFVDMVGKEEATGSTIVIADNIQEAVKKSLDIFKAKYTELE